MPEQGHRTEVVAALVLAVGLVIGLGVARLADGDALWVSALAGLLALTLLVTVPVPWGGGIPTGYALAAAVAALSAPLPCVVVVATGLVLALVVTVLRDGRRPALRALLRLGPCLAAAAAVSAALDAAGGEPPVLVAVAVAAAVVLGIDIAVTRPVVAGDDAIDLRAAWPVHVALACGAALVAVAAEEVGLTMAGVAAFPLVVTRISFSRYASAAASLQQTVRALGLVPELAGLTPLGHGERSAFYAEAIAGRLGFDRRCQDQIGSAARLHHLGAVPFDAFDAADPEPPPSPGEMAVLGASILRQAGFPEPITELVEGSPTTSLQEPAATLESAVVRVASRLDAVVGDDSAKADAGLADVASGVLDRHSRRAVAALLELVVRRPSLVDDAVAAGARFREAAEGVDLTTVLAPAAMAEILPFARRRSS